MKNASTELILLVDDLTLQGENPKFLPRIAFTILAAFALLIGALVHRAIYKLLKKLKDRHINEIIFPSMVVSSVLLVPYLLQFTLKMYVHSLGQIGGEVFCYVLVFISTYCYHFYMHHSFYVAFFRYIFIVKTDYVLGVKWNGKDIARMFLSVMMLFPLFLIITISFFSDLDNYPPLNSCLGQFERIFLYEKHSPICENTAETYIKIICNSFIFIDTFLSCNVVDMFFLYFCQKAISESTNRARPMLSVQSYEKRKSDDGIVLSISICQWLMEVTYMLALIVFYSVFYKMSYNADMFFELLNVTVVLILSPSFYLAGDSSFRSNIANKGILYAIYIALTEDLW